LRGRLKDIGGGIGSFLFDEAADAAALLNSNSDAAGPSDGGPLDDNKRKTQRNSALGVTDRGNKLKSTNLFK